MHNNDDFHENKPFLTDEKNGKYRGRKSERYSKGRRPIGLPLRKWSGLTRLRANRAIILDDTDDDDDDDDPKYSQLPRASFKAPRRRENVLLPLLVLSVMSVQLASTIERC
jgi:hypothetical protein